MVKLQGKMGIGHVRYPTAGSSSSAEAQPFYVNSPYGIVMGHNGNLTNAHELADEIYRTDLRHLNTNSDSEVLLASYIEYGPSCLKKLNGMFAFAIWDSKEKALFAARDRFGVKPFYYTIKDDETFVFSSEINALHEVGIPKLPNVEVWANYFHIGSYGMPHETFWKGICQLEPGHYLVWSKNKVQFYQWYNLENYFEEKPINFTLQWVQAKKYRTVHFYSFKQCQFHAYLESATLLSKPLQNMFMVVMSVQRVCKSL